MNALGDAVVSQDQTLEESRIVSETEGGGIGGDPPQALDSLGFTHLFTPRAPAPLSQRRLAAR